MSQGWGGGGERDLRVDGENFVEECKLYHQLATTRVPTNLTWIKAFRNGDLLVVPHLPEENKVSIHVVDGDFPNCYEYEDGDTTCQNHRIKIRESHGLDGNLSIDNHVLAAWRGKLPWMRLPILQIPSYENHFQKILVALKENPHVRYDKSSLEDFLSSTRERVVAFIQEELNKVAPSKTAISFEAICEYLLKADGYSIEGRNSFDGQGGDLDLRCRRLRRSLSPFEPGETILFAQVKKHKGTSDQQGVDQVVKMMARNPGAEGCVMSLADHFSEEAKKLAEANGVLLINGKEIARLFLANFADKTEA